MNLSNVADGERSLEASLGFGSKNEYSYLWKTFWEKGWGVGPNPDCEKLKIRSV